MLLGRGDALPLHARESALLLTEDDLLWYRVLPHPGAQLRLERGDRVVAFARRHLPRRAPDATAPQASAGRSL